MSEQDGFDKKLAAQFEQEHSQVPSDAFVETTMQKVRTRGRRRDFLRVGWRVGVLGVAVVASPWLVSGVTRLGAVLNSSMNSALGEYVPWVLGGLVLLVALAIRVRSR